MPMNPCGGRLHSRLFRCITGTVIKGVGEEPELGSSNQETAEPHGFAASVSAKALQPTLLYDAVNGVFHDAAVGAHVILPLRPAHTQKKSSVCKQRIGMRSVAQGAPRQELEHHGMFLVT